MNTKTLNSLNDMNPLNIIQDPFWEVYIDCINHDNIKKWQLKNWDRSDTCHVGKYNGSEFVGLRKKDAVSSVDLTQTYNIPSSGFYRVEIRVRRHPDDNGLIKVYDGSTQIGETIKAYHQGDHIERVRFPIRYFTSGSHTLKVSLTRQSFVESLKIEKITRYTGNSDGESQPNTSNIDISSFDFTQNSINQLNTGKIKIAMQDQFWNDDDTYLPLQPGFMDSISIVLGNDRQNAVPMFGGYCLSPSPKETELSVDFVDRLMDLQRNIVYHNFSIGTVPASQNTQNINYIRMGSVYEIARRLSETQEYGLKTYGVPYEYGFYTNFAGPNDFTDTTVTGWVAHRDPTHGMTPPCMKLTLPHYIATDPTTAEVILFNEPLNPYNAVEFNKFFMHYYISGVGSRYPLEFDLKFTMHKANETVSSAVDYYVSVTGQNTLTNVIGDLDLIRDGTWKELSFNLKALFDKIAPSGEYNITKVSLVGQITQDMIDNKKCSAIWIDNCLSYKDLQSAPSYKSENNSKDALSELVDVCDKTKHIAYTRPGIERCDDILVVMPEEINISSTVIDENSNLIELESWKNDPKGNGFCNQSKINFNFSENKSGSAYYTDQISIDHFGPFEKYESSSDINNQTDANNQVRNTVLTNKDTNKVGFGVKIIGTPLIEIGQLMAANILSSRISGTHKIAAITHTMDSNNADKFNTKLDMNFPSSTFMKRMRMINQHRELKNIGLTSVNHTYRNYGNYSMGKASPGAYIN